MTYDRGLPPYPPQRNAWSFPPPPLSRRWRWAPIAVVVVSVVAGTALAVVGVRLGDRDYPSVIDDDRLVAVIKRECRTMTTNVRGVEVTGSAAQQAATVAKQNRAVEAMLAAIRDVDGKIRRSDRPTESWLADWDRLITARELYAAALITGGHPSLRFPRDADGVPIYVRMGDVWLDEPAVCPVPTALLDPYVYETTAT